MRFLLLDTSKEFRGGQQQLCYLAEGLIEAGEDFLVGVRSGSPLEKRLRDSGMPLLPFHPLFEGAPLDAIRMARQLSKWNIALVNAQSSHDHTLAWSASSLLRKPPVRVVTRRVDFVPGGDAFNRRKYLKGADHYIAISAAIRDVLVSYGIAQDRVHLIHSCVPGVERIDNARRDLAAEIGLPENARLIGDVASLVDHKGHEFLLRAMPKVIEAEPNVRLLLVGDGPLQESLERLAANLGIAGNVRFLGRRTDVPKILSALDLFVMTSHLEGLCTSILDAMSSGVPVVATNAGGIPEIVKPGQTGRLANNRDPEAIAAAMIEAIRNPDESARLAQNARTMVREEFAVESMVAATRDLFHRLAARRSQMN